MYLFFRIKFRALSKEITEAKLRGNLKLSCALIVQKVKPKRQGGRESYLTKQNTKAQRV